ncbi:MAG TPA: ABC transporter permease [Wenzhouxiangellaceae bacterium]|nr:ABC transporter permease [Wenzhouxiangellaceae bacterium]
MQITVLVRESARRILKSPRVSSAVVLCIALGMAATASVSTLISLTTLRPLPFPDAERLVRIWNVEQGSARQDALAPADLTDLQQDMGSLDRLEATARSRLIWDRPGEPGRRVEGEAVTPGYFSLLGVKPFMGRLITPDEFSRGEPVMLLSHAAWGREFQFDPDIVGKTIRTLTQNQEITTSYSIVGVLPPDFHGTIEDDMPDLEFFVPFRAYLEADVRSRRDIRNVLAIGRLADGVALPAAQTEADALADTLAPEFAEISERHGFQVERLGASWRAGFNRANGLLAGAAALLLAVAVLNVAMLLVSRTMERRHDLAIRGALGAGRTRLLVPIMGETVLLSLVGGLIGCIVAAPLLSGFLAVAGTDIPSYMTIEIDGYTLTIAFAAMLIGGLLAASLPAWAASRVDVSDSLRDGSGRLTGSRSTSRWGRWIIGGQVALTVTLLLTGSLLGRAYLELGSRDLGFATENRLRMGLFISAGDVPDEVALPAFVDRIEAELMAEPGVLDVALLWPTLPMPSPSTGRLAWPGMSTAGARDDIIVSNFIVDDGFFDGLEIPRVAGRLFDSRDVGTGMRSAVVGESLAELMGGSSDALEREISLNGTPYRVVGVVGDTRFGGPDGPAEFNHQIYLSYAQVPRRVVSPIIEVDGDPAAYAQQLKAALARIAPGSAVDWVEPVDEFIGWLYRDSTFRLALVAAFALSALALVSVGLYAVLAQQVASATPEIGLRKAMGASNLNILSRVVGQGLRVSVTGLGVGLLLGAVFIRFLEGMLHGVSQADPSAWLATTGLVLAIALTACLLPARRAARVEPIEALHHE